NRATIGNMSPEYGSTIAVFPIDDLTIDYMRLTGRDEQQLALVEQYAKVQGLWHEDDREPVYSEKLELDLSQVVPSLAGPKRPQDRVPLSEAKECFRTALDDYTDDDYDIPKGRSDEASMESFPASDSPAVFNGSSEEDKPHGHDHTPMPGRP